MLHRKSANWAKHLSLLLQREDAGDAAAESTNSGSSLVDSRTRISNKKKAEFIPALRNKNNNLCVYLLTIFLLIHTLIENKYLVVRLPMILRQGSGAGLKFCECHLYYNIPFSSRKLQSISKHLWAKKAEDAENFPCQAGQASSN